MSTSRVQPLPVTWDDERDTPFFRIVAHLFTPQFCQGASALLSSYDADPGRPDRSGALAPEGTHSGPATELVAVWVRRAS